MTNREKILLDTIKEIIAAQNDLYILVTMGAILDLPTIRIHMDGTLSLLNDTLNKLNDTGDV